MSGAVDPARPGIRLTEDGRPLREVVSYTRRGGRFTTPQQQAWDTRAAEWVVPEADVAADDFDWAARFGRDAPYLIEIGSGVGEALASIARPEHNVIGIEVWKPGVADTLRRLDKAGIDNVRMCSVDAVWVLEHTVAPGELAELWTFFPDPWHKARHHKRRLVNPDFAALVASRLAVGGTWRLATDWADYAEQMVEVLDAEPLLQGGVVERWDERPHTKFERKGVAKGRVITDLTYIRV
ncbi:tRNA (guanosine(46)-N7)-methyltransferase TrmB [Nocardioides nematodiphilus]|uniref:tRNA (guanosine(46)-N7)-methyltransferase TrmB n=1 Tax=Nocardioides nematodiphilus TaxID=2849669 RepID=UPI001CD91BC4|nr:tRNA (guanosine(46)-N7)-methyltransferase TrmB [Nocardioides nematodiphilus]MCA1981367.1 tRNA (guanosine(46)-N7)-methyltransferase TrmB [Nocardioides nematodiphilus]